MFENLSKYDNKGRLGIEIATGGNMNFDKVSRYISFMLRHNPEAVDKNGWADVQELIANIAKGREFNMEMLEEIVRTDQKQRYSFNDDKTKIRANQGHSIPVDVELEMVEPPTYLWHGTGKKYVESIDEQGLISKSRLYVHLSQDRETAIEVGKRHGKVALYRVKSGEMYKDGFQFFRSVNKVWLTKEVPAQYLEKK